MLQLQDLTVNDIETFVTEKTLANSAFRRLAEQEPQATSKLIQEIVGKAKGVFLWVYVVVIDLSRGIRKRDSVPDLWGRLKALPNVPESLYRHIMSHIESAHLIRASKSFLIARAAREVKIPKRLINRQLDSKQLQGSVSLRELYFALNKSLTGKGVETMSQEVLDNKCGETECHIIARCACLSEVIKAKDQSETTSSALVQYLHRTARDFLEGRDRWSEILDRIRNILFDPYWYMMPTI
jgi:hypothetical protein